MSAVELAVNKVKRLSQTEAQQLLAWLSSRPSAAPVAAKKGAGITRSISRPNLKAWRKSVQLKTDWEPQRMPDDVAKVIAL